MVPLYQAHAIQLFLLSLTHTRVTLIIIDLTRAKHWLSQCALGKLPHASLLHLKYITTRYVMFVCICLHFSFSVSNVYAHDHDHVSVYVSVSIYIVVRVYLVVAMIYLKHQHLMQNISYYNNAKRNYAKKLLHFAR
jgi:hypothetical protein